MDSQTLHVLGFPKVLDIIQSYAHSSMGKAVVARLSPSIDRREIEERLARVNECRAFADRKGRLSFSHLQDPSPVLTNLAIEGQVLQPREFLVLLDVLKAAKDVRRAFAPTLYPHIGTALRELPTLEGAVLQIEKVFDPSGEIRENADPDLGAARRRQTEARAKAQEQLRQYFTGPRAKFLIDEPFITIRNNRYVIPVKIEHQREIPGVVHSASSSGATSFIEPFPLVELNNECVYYADLEQEIIARILRDLSNYLRPSHFVLEHLTGKIAEIDALFACAEFARRFGCTAPVLNESRALQLRQARHPLLIETLGETRVVPISVELSADHNALVISGPNTGGKTVALKTIGLLSLIAQSGIPVPAVEAHIPIFHQVLADIGDYQSITEQLSTFSAHILTVKKMMEVLEPPSLILLDEIGRATDPIHGAALGIALIDFFRRRDTLVVGTTHHQAIKSFAFTTPGVKSAGVELDPVTLRPTYELKFGLAGASSGVEIAAQLGLPEPVIAEAWKLLEERELQAERYLRTLQQELQGVERRQQELDREVKRLQEHEKQLNLEFARKGEQLHREAQKAIEAWAEEFKRETDRFLKTVRDKMEAARLQKEARRKEALLKEVFRRKVAAEHRAKDAEFKAVGPLREGDRVYHSLFRKKGRVLEVREDQAVVEIEGKKVSAALDQLEKVDEKETVRELPRNVTVRVVEEEVEPELNLLGCTVEEALPRADKFLDRAFLSQLREVRIIHGFGTGKLRAALSEFLSEHPQVQAFRTEGGVTFVQIKD